MRKKEKATSATKIERSKNVRWLAYWSTNGSKRYPINMRNIEPKSVSVSELKAYSEVKNQILAYQTVTVEASYDRATKKLTIYPINS